MCKYNTKELSLYGVKIPISKELELFTNLRNIFIDKSLKNRNIFIKKYYGYKSIEEALTEVPKLAVILIDDTVEEAINYLVSNKIMDCSKDLFWDRYAENYFDYTEYYLKVLNAYQSIILKENQIKEVRDIKKSCRSRWEGGGFGLKGAIKGAITASMLNLGTDALRNIKDSVVANIDSNKINKFKNGLLNHEETLEILASGIQICSFSVFYGLISELDIRKGSRLIEFNKTSAEAKFDNTKKYIKEKKQIINFICECIQDYPYNFQYYKFLIESIGDKDGEVSKVASYFGYAYDIDNFKENYIKKIINGMSMKTDTDVEDIIKELENVSVKLNLDISDQISDAKKLLISIREEASAKLELEKALQMPEDSYGQIERKGKLVEKYAGILNEDMDGEIKRIHSKMKEEKEKENLIIKANGGDVESQIKLAKTYNNEGNKDKFFEYIEMAAKKGNALAQNYFGTNLFDYKPKEAIYWIEESAKQGLLNSQKSLANIYIQDEFKDLKRAFTWNLEAAKQGDLESMNIVGLCYKSGKGVDIDIGKSIDWLKKSADEGYLSSIWNLGNLYDSNGEYEKAFPYIYSAANKEHMYAQELLSVYYNLGRVVEKNEILSKEWMEKSAENGSGLAQSLLGMYYKNGVGCTKDINKAIYWYKKGVEQNKSIAQNDLGIIYYEGKHTIKDYNKAFELFSKASNQGNIESSYYLGSCYELGYGVDKDVEKAKEYYSIAKKGGYEKLKDLGNKKNSKCFITSAVCKSFGKSDECYELTLFRQFRDEWLINSKDGKNLVLEYYKVAPTIVDTINLQENSNEIYINIWNEYLYDCMKYIEIGKLNECKNTYIRMVEDLICKYIF